MTTCNLAEGGAGAGGTIYILHSPTATDASFSGSGSIVASGGNGGTAGTFDCHPGGGGRIHIDSPLLHYPDDDETNPPHYQFPLTNIVANGGGGNGQAAAGTIAFTGDGFQYYDTLLVKQNGVAPTGSTKTVIPGTALQSTFNRVEASGAAEIDFLLDPIANPIACYELTSSNVVYPTLTCSNFNNPDNPDTLYINNSEATAQSGDEPGYDATPPTGDPNPLALQDLTPEFSVVFRHPGAPTTDHYYVEIQVAKDETFLTNIIWNATGSNRITLDTAVQDGDIMEDIVYDQNGVATEALSTTGGPYYVRMRFRDSTNSYDGLWTHADYNDHYSFDIDQYQEITAGCAGAITIDNAGEALMNTNGYRMGTGDCTITYDSTITPWYIYYTLDSDETNFDDGSGNDINPIANGSSDCDIDTNVADEEYGFNIDTVTSGTVQSNAQCLGQCTPNDYDNTNCYFDIPSYATQENIIVGSSVTSGDQTFDVNMYANVDGTTVAGTYNLDTLLTITTSP
jgi:hypothetical protein